MAKDIYTEAKLEVIRFENEDVITTSCDEPVDYGDDDNI